MSYDSWNTIMATARNVENEGGEFAQPLLWLGRDSSFEQRLVFEWTWMGHREERKGNNEWSRHEHCRAREIIAKIDVQVYAERLEQSVDGNLLSMDADAMCLHDAKAKLKIVQAELRRLHESATQKVAA